MRRLLRRCALCSTLLVLITSPVAVLGQAEPQNGRTRAELEADFEKLIEGAHLIGQFSVTGPQGTSQPQVDTYSVSELTRGDDSTWVFKYTMSYGGGNKATFPIPVKVEWAGDTPMLTMTDQEVPGIGTFSVRVLIYDNLYAGTWSNGPIGGHMWGRISKDPPTEESADAAPPP